MLGVDGMDPGFVERHWDALPNLSRLRRQGTFQRLATTTPPQSPVAWSTFATGTDPEQHGIYDFVHRNPSTLEPFSSLAETEPPRHSLALGPWLIPLDKGAVRSFRRGTTFWEVLGSHGVPANLLRMPANYPAARFEGRALSGMGVPDLQGTFGTFTLYSDNPFDLPRDVPGGHIVRTKLNDHRGVLSIRGPANSLRRDARVTTADMTVEVDPDEPAARFTMGDQQFILRQGEWSDWLHVSFSLLPGGVARLSGIVRVFAEQLHPGFRVYVSPVNADPSSPGIPISWPEDYSKTLAESIGPFHTLGIREDTSALRAAALTLPEYQTQSRMVIEEDLRLLRHALGEFREGLLFFYFSGIDQNSHVLWGAHEDELLDTYKAVDQAIGMVAQAVPGAVLVVMSDHGFSSFTRGFNPNTWLLQNGYMFLKQDAPRQSDPQLRDVDWTRTRAYSVGLNAVYLNLSGREKHGIVKSGTESDRLLQSIESGLVGYRDESRPAPVISSVKLENTRLKFAPDLIIGYGEGYRASWGAALGTIEPEVLQDNQEAWIGDHCIDARSVPGVLFVNTKSGLADPTLKDLTVTILHLFDVPAPASMKGRVIF